MRTLWFALICCFASAQVQAQTSPDFPALIPAQPLAGQDVTLVFALGGCFISQENVDGLTQEVRVNGQQIDVFLSFLGTPCGVPPPAVPQDYFLGAFGQGEFQFSVYTIFADESFPDTTAGLTPGFETTLRVGGPAPVPVLSLVGYVFLMLSLLLLAVWKLRRRIE